MALSSPFVIIVLYCVSVRLDFIGLLILIEAITLSESIILPQFVVIVFCLILNPDELYNPIDTVAIFPLFILRAGPYVIITLLLISEVVLTLLDPFVLIIFIVVTFSVEFAIILLFCILTSHSVTFSMFIAFVFVVILL